MPVRGLHRLDGDRTFLLPIDPRASSLCGVERRKSVLCFAMPSKKERAGRDIQRRINGRAAC
jgi:hypothetical protein